MHAELIAKYFTNQQLHLYGMMEWNTGMTQIIQNIILI